MEEIITAGNRIEYYRTQPRFTQKELAEKSGLYQAAIAKYENAIAIPQNDPEIKIAEALNISAAAY